MLDKISKNQILLIQPLFSLCNFQNYRNARIVQNRKEQVTYFFSKRLLEDKNGLELLSNEVKQYAENFKLNKLKLVSCISGDAGSIFFLAIRNLFDRLWK